jgi:hypothetical protein
MALLRRCGDVQIWVNEIRAIPAPERANKLFSATLDSCVTGCLNRLYKALSNQLRNLWHFHR